MKELHEGLKNLMEISHQLSRKLEDASDWDDQDDKRLEKLSKIVVVLVKLYPYSETEETEQIDAKEDDAIIARFLERNSSK